jgi:hypothetical protein
VERKREKVSPFGLYTYWTGEGVSNYDYVPKLSERYFNKRKDVSVTMVYYESCKS